MKAISALLMTYLVNAVWQVPAIAITAALCARFMRRTPSEYTHRLWVAALLLSTLLPLLSLGSAVGGLDPATAAKQVPGEIPNSITNGSTPRLLLAWQRHLSTAPLLRTVPRLASDERFRPILHLQSGPAGLGVAENDAIPCGFVRPSPARSIG